MNNEKILNQNRVDELSIYLEYDINNSDKNKKSYEKYYYGGSPNIKTEDIPLAALVGEVEYPNKEMLLNEPYHYAKNRKEQMILDINKEHEENLKNIENIKEKFPICSDTNENFGLAAIGTSFIGFFIGCTQCLSSFSNSPSVFFIWLFLGAFVGVCIEIYLIEAVKDKNKISLENIRKQSNIEENNLHQRINVIKQQCYDDIKKYEVMYCEKVTAMRNLYDEKVKTTYDMFVESPLIIKVVKWIIDGYEDMIVSVDRSKSIEYINVPFIVNVYKNMIECNLGNFDFETERYQELSNGAEREALTKVIASLVQHEILVKFQKDISGTDVKVLVSKDKYFSTTITYVAKNGYYEPINNW